MRAWMNGALLSDPGAPAGLLTDHALTVGDGVFAAIKVVDGQPFALTPRLGPPARAAASVARPEVEDAGCRAGGAAVRAGRELPLGRSRITDAGGPAPRGSGRGDEPPTLVVVADRMAPWPPTTAVA